MTMSHRGRKPLVAIVGRPNVGKSTLYNRLAGRPTAIVSEIAGTTRDRVSTETVWADHPFILVDTGGLDLGKDGPQLAPAPIWDQVKRHIQMAVEDADVIIFTVDAHAGVTTTDREIGEWLRTVNKPVVVAGNKSDNVARELEVFDLYELGLGDPVPISAYHNTGIDELMARVVSYFPDEAAFAEPDSDLKIALIGRPNTGKSMLLNAIVGEERSIVSEVPGTTRDTVDTLVKFDDMTVLLVDTAGIRRRGSIDVGIEKYSVLRSIRAIDRADVAILVMDATELATAQDTHIAAYILEAYKGVILVVNKWDLAGKEGLDKATATRRLREKFKFMPYAPICFVSALKKSGIPDLLATAVTVSHEWQKGVPRYDLRRTILNAVAAHPPATVGKHAANIYSVSQDGVGPPSFTFYVNHAEMVHFSYQRFLENTLRDAYGFEGSPLKIRFRGRRDEK